jgi:hypothetical protein
LNFGPALFSSNGRLHQKSIETAQPLILLFQKFKSATTFAAGGFGFGSGGTTPS